MLPKRLHPLDPLCPPGRRLPRLAVVEPLAGELASRNSMMLTALSGFASSYRMVNLLTTGLGGRSAEMDGLMTGLGYNPSSR